VDRLDAFNCGIKRERQSSGLRKVHCWISSPSFSSKLDACELINGIPQQWCWIVFDRLNDAGKNHRKLHLQWSRRKVLSAANFLKLRGHAKPRSPARQLPSLDPPRQRPQLGRLSLRCVSADRAPTYPARKTKPSDREAGARLGDHDPPTPTDRAERSREREMSGLAAASSFIQDFGRCSSPVRPPQCRSPTARQHLGQTVTAGCPN